MPSPSPAPHVLGDLTVERFLAEYWQKKPLLIRQAIPGFTGPLEADDLAGLACEPEAESRIVLETGGTPPWELRHGPFDEADFATLPPERWTLLVQGVDRWVPEVAELLEGFRFIPSWRIDDVMVSYGAPKGGVGAHYDQYDVFLLQGAGYRRWRVGPRCDAASPRVEGVPLRILKEMPVTDEWVLAPGDMLYLPPGFAHDGVAEPAPEGGVAAADGGCLTYSIGFRAPSAAELATAFADALAERAADGAEEPRYADPGLAPQPNPGMIAPDALDRARALLRAALEDDEAVAGWFGRHVTEPKPGAPVEPPGRPMNAKALAAKAAKGAALVRSADARLAFIDRPDGSATLFADGDARPCPAGPAADLARAVAGRPSVPLPADLPPEAVEVALWLVNQGLVSVE
ncbi:cupin domain-containing protein [Inquilinus sp. CAU 1745]|uniref:cupin domain-containing protein n=1 Tax=Inquilinus sp. CAU 1745 TaxID=3140369 RepID=UPI00325A8AC0